MSALRQIFYIALVLASMLETIATVPNGAVHQYNKLNPLSTSLQRITNIIPRNQLPGGGFAIYVDYQAQFYKHCANGYTGCLPDPYSLQYYYVCNRDSFILAKCGNLQFFNATLGVCKLYKFLKYFQPICKRPGQFPIPGELFVYYSCNEHLQPNILTCPRLQYFSPIFGVCITPQQIVLNINYAAEQRDNDFPSCRENGLFASPRNSSLYYACELQSNHIFLQTRYQCPNGTIYNTVCNNCQSLKGKTKAHAESVTSLSSDKWFVESSVNVVTALSKSASSVENSTVICSDKPEMQNSKNVTVTELVFTFANNTTVLSSDMKSTNPAEENVPFADKTTLSPFDISSSTTTSLPSTESINADTATTPNLSLMTALALLTTEAVVENTTITTSSISLKLSSLPTTVSMVDNTKSIIINSSSSDRSTLPIDMDAPTTPVTNLTGRDTSTETIMETTAITPTSMPSSLTSLVMSGGVTETSTLISTDIIGKNSATTPTSISVHHTSLSTTESIEDNTKSTITNISSSDRTTLSIDMDAPTSPVTNLTGSYTSTETIIETTAIAPTSMPSSLTSLAMSESVAETSTLISTELIGKNSATTPTSISVHHTSLSTTESIVDNTKSTIINISSSDRTTLSIDMDSPTTPATNSPLTENPQLTDTSPLFTTEPVVENATITTNSIPLNLTSLTTMESMVDNTKPTITEISSSDRTTLSIDMDSPTTPVINSPLSANPQLTDTSSLLSTEAVVENTTITVSSISSNITSLPTTESMVDNTKPTLIKISSLDHTTLPIDMDSPTTPATNSPLTENPQLTDTSPLFTTEPVVESTTTTTNSIPLNLTSLPTTVSMVDNTKPTIISSSDITTLSSTESINSDGTTTRTTNLPLLLPPSINELVRKFDQSMSSIVKSVSNFKESMKNIFQQLLASFL